jgi:Na+/H+ antiporter NhaD/arsenite permease-like protein
MRFIGFLSLVAATILGTFLLGWTPQQILATSIFGSFIFGTLLYWRFRLAFALIGTLALLATGVIDLPSLIEFASLDVILFLIGMMIIIGFLEERKFFEAIVERFLGRFLHRTALLVGGLMVVSAVTAALVDEVTSILFMSAITLQIARRYHVNPVPFIIMIVFATNIGSSATVVGNPIGVLIAFRGGLTFVDFLRWATPIAIISLGLCIPLAMWYFRSEIGQLRDIIKATPPSPHVAVARLSRSDAYICTALFLGTIVGLIFHHNLEVLLGIEKNSLLVGVALGGAGTALLIEQQGARELVSKRVDWWTLTFFMLLFASVGTLKFVGVTGQIAKAFLQISGQEILLLGVVTWGSGILSAFMDNVLAVATIIPVLSDLQALDVPVEPLWWGLLFGGTFFGNATMVGSTANIVALGILERDEKRHVSFLEWLKPGLLVGIPTLLLAQILLSIQFFLLR